jgi:uncharacterized protein (DUF1697 family)
LASGTSTYVILLRAIGPATHKLMTMSRWREAAAAAGFLDPETLVNTGNMLAGYAGTVPSAARAMAAVLQDFGLGANVVPIIRRPRQLRKLIKADPIGHAAQERPSQTGVFFFAAPQPDFAWLGNYEGPEVVHQVEGHLIVDFMRDVAQSGRLIRLIDKHCGVNTARNWNSVRRIAERSLAREKDSIGQA